MPMFGGQVAAKSPAEYAITSHEVRSVMLAPMMQFLEDPLASITVSQLDNPHHRAQWRHQNQDIFNFGYTASRFWFRGVLVNQMSEPFTGLVEIAYPLLDVVDIYVIREGNRVETYEMGDRFAFDQRLLDHRHFLLPIEFAAQERVQLILAVQSTSSLQVPIKFWHERSFYENDQYYFVGIGFFFGIMAVMFLYNFFLFCMVREKNYLFYVLYVVGVSFFIGSLNGLTYQYFWPQYAWWSDSAILMSLSMVVVFASVFNVKFLELFVHFRMLAGLFVVLIWISLLTMLATFWLPYPLAVQITIFIAILTCFLTIISGLMRCRNDVSARYYTLAWAFLAVGGLVLAANKMGWVERTLLSENAVHIGAAMEAIFLSFALGERINQEKRLRYQAQKEALLSEQLRNDAQLEAFNQEQQARIAKEQALSLQLKTNELLEDKVKERTSALAAANNKLKDLSVTDGLTGVKNRRYFDQQYPLELKRSHRLLRPLAILVVDIDYFKQVNDRYGHLVGDTCLRQVAAILAAQVGRPDDFVARYGGEEFVVVLSLCDMTGAEKIAEQIRCAVEQMEIVEEGHQLSLTVSIGFAARVPDSHEDTYSLLKSADEALYQAKAKGRNRIEFAQSL